MKRLILSLLVGVALLFTSCNNDLELVAGWKEIPVVYGFLSPSDTAQYIRVEKAFIDETVAPNVVAQIPDSLYFQNISVDLVLLSTGQRFPLQRVDGNLEGYPRKAGVFASAPNYLYKIKTDQLAIQTDKLYRLEVRDESGRVITSAETPVVGTYVMQASNPQQEIFFRYDKSLTFGWNSLEKSAYFYDLTLRVNVTEFTDNDPATAKSRTIEWPVERSFIRGGSQPRVQVPGIGFYRFLSQALEADPRLSRKFESIDIVVDAGAESLYEYLSVGQANSGITGAEFVPSFSNIDNGRGLFSSRSRLVAKGFTINITTFDSLQNGVYTKDLNFF